MGRIALLSAAATLSLLATAARGEPVISDAWVRAMPPTQSMTAGYLKLDNTGTRPITITGASSDASPRVEIHTTVMRDGLQRMQPVASLEVAPGESIELAPGGHHLMLREMSDMPAEGDRVELCLELDSGDRLCSEARVARNAAQAPSHQHH